MKSKYNIQYSFYISAILVKLIINLNYFINLFSSNFYKIPFFDRFVG